MVMASAPGGTGPPTHSRYPARREITPSVEPRRELLAVVRGAWVVRAEQLEQIDELLAGALVLHPVEQGVQPRLDVAVALHLLAHACQRRHPPRLSRLGDARQQGQGSL